MGGAGSRVMGSELELQQRILHDRAGTERFLVAARVEPCIHNWCPASPRPRRVQASSARAGQQTGTPLGLALGEGVHWGAADHRGGAFGNRCGNSQSAALTKTSAAGANFRRPPFVVVDLLSPIGSRPSNKNSSREPALVIWAIRSCSSIASANASSAADRRLRRPHRMCLPQRCGPCGLRSSSRVRRLCWEAAKKREVWKQIVQIATGEEYSHVLAVSVCCRRGLCASEPQ